jgi:hypothetical protein
MYSIDERDKVVPLPDVPQSSVGAPLPIILSDEHCLLLTYLLQTDTSDWDGASVRVVDLESSGEPLALVEFSGYASFMFGAPNDEAFHGHPLYSRGLKPYSAFVIENSSWIRQLERMNSVHPHHTPKRYEQLKHYVFAFHDSTFECAAESFTLTELSGSLAEILPEMQKRLLQ